MSCSFNFLVVFPHCLGISGYNVKTALFSLLAEWLDIIIEYSLVKMHFLLTDSQILEAEASIMIQDFCETFLDCLNYSD